MTREVVLAGAVRTPIGRLLGSLTGYSATDLGALVVEETLNRTNLAPDVVDEVIMGNVIQAGVGQNPARQCALNAGLPETVAAFTVNKVCGSGLKSVMLADQAIRLGQAEAIIAGGTESMTNAPGLVHVRGQTKYPINHQIQDAMDVDGLRDAFDGIPMGETGEIVADEHGITREDADAFAVRSHKLAAEATENGWFKDEILPVEAQPAGRRRGGPETLSQDEGIRPGSSIESLGRLRTVFRKDGIVTAGNASQISDGASAMVVTSREHAEEHGLPILATVQGYATAGVSPERVMSAPIPGTEKLLDQLDLTVDDIDLFEHNEAFASASCAVRAHFNLPEEKFNISGGAVALGHPLGCSGARVLTTLLYNLQRTGGQRGLATLCLGGGNSVQMVVEAE
ncbi:MAG: thiolase family protein [Candidatus Thermoplasmatota archaeon]|nr:thiolase family protein [Candidatus Thermoplasmatota archaeon]